MLPSFAKPGIRWICVFLLFATHSLHAAVRGGRVGVLRAVEPAFRGEHLAAQVFQRAGKDVAVGKFPKGVGAKGERSIKNKNTKKLANYSTWTRLKH